MLITRKRCLGRFPGREVSAPGSIKNGKENRNRSSGTDEDKVVLLTVFDDAYGIDGNKLYQEKENGNGVFIDFGKNFGKYAVAFSAAFSKTFK
jgi:hypothetical protein